MDLIARLKRASIAATASLAMFAGAVHAQELESIDPDGAYANAIDGDLASSSEPPSTNQVHSAGASTTYVPPVQASVDDAPLAPQWSNPEAVDDPLPADASTVGQETYSGTETTYGEDDLIGAAEGVFGKGAEGLASLIEKALKEQGEPNAYIVGREAGGAFVVGARYGSGTLHHKIEGKRPVYWTGPSIGFDAGANAANTFVLVYNLYDSEELYERYPAGEGQAYVVGGLHASYLRKGDVVMIPIRVGAGLRLGVNAGYMKFSKKQRWLPF